MKSKLMLISLPLTMFLAGCASSSPQAARAPTELQAKDLAHRMVQVAADRYREGRLESAKKILQTSLEIDPDSAEARYYLRLVRESKYQEPLQLWYPTIPPQRTAK